MEATVNVDKVLLQEVMQTAETASESDTVNDALRLVLRLRAQAKIRDLRGKLHWEGDLDQSRLGRFFDEEK